MTPSTAWTRRAWLSGAAALLTACASPTAPPPDSAAQIVNSAAATAPATATVRTLVRGSAWRQRHPTTRPISAGTRNPSAPSVPASVPGSTPRIGRGGTAPGVTVSSSTPAVPTWTSAPTRIDAAPTITFGRYNTESPNRPR